MEDCEGLWWWFFRFPLLSNCLMNLIKKERLHIREKDLEHSEMLTEYFQFILWCYVASGRNSRIQGHRIEMKVPVKKERWVRDRVWKKTRQGLQYGPCSLLPFLLAFAEKHAIAKYAKIWLYVPETDVHAFSPFTPACSRHGLPPLCLSSEKMRKGNFSAFVVFLIIRVSFSNS